MGFLFVCLLLLFQRKSFSPFYANHSGYGFEGWWLPQGKIRMPMSYRYLFLCKLWTPKWQVYKRQSSRRFQEKRKTAFLITWVSLVSFVICGDCQTSKEFLWSHLEVLEVLKIVKKKVRISNQESRLRRDLLLRSVR